MKKVFMMVCLFCVYFAYGQNIFTEKNSISAEAKEAYLVDLFVAGKVVSCNYEGLDENALIKKIRIIFSDTTFFFEANIFSGICTQNAHYFGCCESAYVDMDDGTIDGCQIDFDTLEESPKLKATINAILRDACRK